MSSEVLKFEYSKLLDEYDSYNIYKKEKLKDKALKSDFLNKLKKCPNLIKVTNNNFFIKSNSQKLRYNQERMGKPLLYFKKLTIIRWIFFILAVYLTILFYVLLLQIFKDIVITNDIFTLNTLMDIVNLIAGIYLYLIAVETSTNLVIVHYRFMNSNKLTKFIKFLPIFLFPFNKFTTDNFAIYFIIGEKGMLCYSKTSDKSFHDVYSYVELLDNKSTYWNINDFLDEDCKEKILELSKKYYS